MIQTNIQDNDMLYCLTLKNVDGRDRTFTITNNIICLLLLHYVRII